MRSIKGIILAGGYGSRLYPLTLGVSKQLLPVYDKPMIYYPLSVFLLAGIKDILIISTKEDLPKFKNLLGDGTNLGVKISYKFQLKPTGIAESFIIGKDFIGSDNVCLILGDNIFHGKKFISQLETAKNYLRDGFSSIFGVKVNDPKNFGVIEFDNNNNMLSITEKPTIPKSNYIVSGLYFYTNDVINYAKMLKPSSRGEKEITDINNYFLLNNRLKLNLLESSTSWIDTGTYTSLIRASKYFHDIEIKTSKKEACIEEIAYSMGYIGKKKIKEIAITMNNSDYGKYLAKIINK
jgi:glucose-1-phosphate thymidylyltransferase